MWAGQPWTVLLVAANLAWLIVMVGMLGLIDLRSHVLPNRLVLLGWSVQVALLVILSLITQFHGGLDRLIKAVIGCMVMVGFYLIIFLFSRGQFGMGDVKFSAQLGLVSAWVGWETWFWALLTPFFLGGLVAALLLLFRRLALKDHIPFGPFMGFGTLLAIGLTSAGSV